MSKKQQETDNLLNTRYLDLLEVINEFQGDLGVRHYQITVKDLQESLEQRSNIEVAERTLYRYLRKMQQNGWIRKSSRTVKVYSPLKIKDTAPGKTPIFYLVDENGIEVPLDEIPQVIYHETGEKTLISFKLTKDGKKLVEEYQKTKIKKEER